jgi:hypothetical protein
MDERVCRKMTQKGHCKNRNVILTQTNDFVVLLLDYVLVSTE